MKKYLTSEAIAMLEKNPNLEFVNSKGMELRVSFGAARFFEGGKNISRFGIGLVEWELIQEPVDFLTAVEAYSEGKTIRCEDSKWGSHTYKIDEFSDEIKDTKGIAVSTHEVLKGVWYVEE
jgi:hypothetical protein